MKRGLDHLVEPDDDEGDQDMSFDYEDYEDGFENVAGAKPGQRYG